MRLYTVKIQNAKVSQGYMALVMVTKLSHQNHKAQLGESFSRRRIGRDLFQSAFQMSRRGMQRVFCILDV